MVTIIIVMSAGRPTKYKEEYCDSLIDHFKQGGSINEFCLELDIAKETFYNWCKVHPEFMDSKKKGEALSEGWWMKMGRSNLKDKEFNYTGWYMNMKNRFGWADRQQVDNNITGGGITIEVKDSGLADEIKRVSDRTDKDI